MRCLTPWCTCSCCYLLSQGLQYLPGGIFVEGTGLYGHSSLRKVDVNTGEVLASVPLDRKYFGKESSGCGLA